MLICFFFYSSVHHRDLHSFPTRRSSDLELRIGNYVIIGWNATIADTDFHPIAPAERIADAMACSPLAQGRQRPEIDRKSTRLNSSHLGISYAVFCLKKKKNKNE